MKVKDLIMKLLDFPMDAETYFWGGPDDEVLYVTTDVKEQEHEPGEDGRTTGVVIV